MQEMQDNTRPLIRPSALSKMMGLSPQRIYALIKNGTLPSCKVSGVIYIPRGAFETWLAQIDSEALGNVKQMEGGSNNATH